MKFPILKHIILKECKYCVNQSFLLNLLFKVSQELFAIAENHLTGLNYIP